MDKKNWKILKKNQKIQNLRCQKFDFQFFTKLQDSVSLRVFKLWQWSWLDEISHGDLTPPKTAVLGGNFFCNIFSRICRTLLIQSALKKTTQAGSFDMLVWYSISHIFSCKLIRSWKVFHKMTIFLRSTRFSHAHRSIILRKLTKISFSCDKISDMCFVTLKYIPIVFLDPKEYFMYAQF